MTHEEIEILTHCAEIIGALKDQLRGHGTDADRDIASRLTQIEADLHAVISRAEQMIEKAG